MRRLAIQGMLWALGREDLIPEKGVNTEVAGTYDPNPSGEGPARKAGESGYKSGLKDE